MNKYKLEDLVNSGTHARKEIKSNVHIGDTYNGYAKGDILDANATAEFVIDKIDDVVSGVIPTIPTNVSAFNNDANYLTQHQDISGKADASDVEAIESKIPNQATAQNQLADKGFVNSSIATATADFKGTVNSVDALDNFTADNNDYAFVVTIDQAGNTVYKRYKYNGTAWVFEYDLNNSSFTAVQWAAIQSGITDALVSKLSALPTNDTLTTSLGGKVDKVNNATNGNLAGLDANGNLTDSGISANGVVASTSVRTIVTLTQAQYDALATKDANTEYNIIESV